MWERFEENGMQHWEHPSLGFVRKVDNKFVVFYPRIVKVGPFDDLEKAKMMLEDYRGAIDNVIEQTVTSLVEDSKNWK